MHHIRAASHGTAMLDIDHCRPCGLVWFDRMESVKLSALGWIALLRELQIGATPDRPQTPRLHCPVCRTALKEIRNLSRFGRFPAQECPGCGGHLHTQAGMLAERGLVRPLLAAERYALKAEKRQLCCLNCGAPSDGSAEHCTFCSTPLVMLDVPRLSEALRFRSPMLALMPKSEVPQVAWACRGCGAPLDPTRQTRCGQCDHAVVVPSLPAISPLLDTLEREWRDRVAQLTAARKERVASYRSKATWERRVETLEQKTARQSREFAEMRQRMARMVFDMERDHDAEPMTTTQKVIVGVLLVIMFLIQLRR